MSEDFATSVNQQAIEASNMVLKTLIIMHGGATIALLAFLGNLIGKTPPLPSARVADVAQSITLFGWGLVLSVVAMVFAYWTHYFTVGTQWGSEKRKDDFRAGKAIVHVLAVCLTVASLVLFVRGMFNVQDAVVLLVKV